MSISTVAMSMDSIPGARAQEMLTTVLVPCVSRSCHVALLNFLISRYNWAMQTFSAAIHPELNNPSHHPKSELSTF